MTKESIQAPQEHIATDAQNSSFSLNRAASLGLISIVAFVGPIESTHAAYAHPSLPTEGAVSTLDTQDLPSKSLPLHQFGPLEGQPISNNPNVLIPIATVNAQTETNQVDSLAKKKKQAPKELHIKNGDIEETVIPNFHFSKNKLPNDTKQAPDAKEVLEKMKGVNTQISYIDVQNTTDNTSFEMAISPEGPQAYTHPVPLTADTYRMSLYGNNTDTQSAWIRVGTDSNVQYKLMPVLIKGSFDFARPIITMNQNGDIVFTTSQSGNLEAQASGNYDPQNGLTELTTGLISLESSSVNPQPTELEWMNNDTVPQSLSDFLAGKINPPVSIQFVNPVDLTDTLPWGYENGVDPSTLDTYSSLAINLGTEIIDDHLIYYAGYEIKKPGQVGTVRFYIPFCVDGTKYDDSSYGIDSRISKDGTTIFTGLKYYSLPQFKEFLDKNIGRGTEAYGFTKYTSSSGTSDEYSVAQIQQEGIAQQVSHFLYDISINMADFNNLPKFVNYRPTSFDSSAIPTIFALDINKKGQS